MRLLKRLLLFMALATAATAIFPAHAQSYRLGDASIEQGGIARVSVTITGTRTAPSYLLFYTGAPADTAKPDVDYSPVARIFRVLPTDTKISIDVPTLKNDSIPGPLTKLSTKLVVLQGGSLLDGTGVVSIPDSDVAMQTCWDNSVIPATSACPPRPTQTCWDDSVIFADLACPVRPTKVCPDGSTIFADLVCPASPPPPMPMPVAGDYIELSPSLDGLPLQTAHDYHQDIAKTWGSGVIPDDNGTDPVGAYRQICGTAGLGFFDPVLYPKQPGKGHLHDIVGKRNAGADTTAATLIGPGTSTCNDNPLGTASQNSLYWQPALFDGLGNVIRIDYGSGYYKRVPKSHPDCQHATLGNICIPVPNGLKLFVGHYPDGTLAPFTKGSTAPGINQIQWKCVGTGAVGTPQPDLEALLAISPVCPQLDQVIAFPACWDGKHLWLPKAAHMAWQVRNATTGKSACPATHPYKLPAITFQYFRTTDANWAKGTYCLSSDMKGPRCDQNPTVKRGSTNHGDALIVWEVNARNRMEAGCINGHKNCSGGDLGDGGQFIGASVPYYVDPATGKRVAKWTNPVRLTPIDSVSTTQQSQAH